MINNSPISLLLIWSELEQCYYNDNGYGGDTAEIYAYRCMMYSPIIMHNPKAEWVEDEFKKAKTILYNILKHFCEQRDCQITVYDIPLEEWYNDKNESFVHRAHVKVIRN